MLSCLIVWLSLKKINYECPGLGELAFIGKSLHRGNDFLVKYKGHSKNVDVLVFFDSRGIGLDNQGSIADKIENFYSDSNLLLICRPLELTTWATLINFLSINKTIKPKKIITNMGFVDFTPKKLAILDDAMAQVEFGLGKNIVTIEAIEKYLSSNGEIIQLYGMKYCSMYKQSIELIAKNCKLLCLNTPLLKKGIKINRDRPQSFFNKLVETNTFNNTIKNIQTIELPEFSEIQTYDGVHYTNDGNNIIFKELKPWL